MSCSVLGLMSGTSLDGVDLAVCSFAESDKIEFEIKAVETIPYNQYWQKCLSDAHNLNASELTAFDIEYGKYLGELCKYFIGKSKLKVNFIASHGHTIFHKPEKGISLQIGSGAAIAAMSGLICINDFRKTDIVLGGQGAPLVPIGDKLLLPEYSHCLNIGGIANISYDKGNSRIAFDICPANMVLNYIAEKLGYKYDEGGRISSSGRVDDTLLNSLNNLSYYHIPPPKSLGREWVYQNVIPLIEETPITPEDVLSTFVEHIAYQISKHITDNSNILITGGGAHNKHLIERVGNRVNTIINLPDNMIIDFKEAMVFAFLGYLRFHGRQNVLASVTGALRDSCSGAIYTP